MVSQDRPAGAGACVRGDDDESVRVFDHHYARYLVRFLTDEGRSDPEAGLPQRENLRLAPATLQSGKLQVEAAEVLCVAEEVTRTASAVIDETKA